MCQDALRRIVVGHHTFQSCCSGFGGSDFCPKAVRVVALERWLPKAFLASAAPYTLGYQSAVFCCCPKLARKLRIRYIWLLKLLSIGPLKSPELRQPKRGQVAKKICSGDGSCLPKSMVVQVFFAASTFLTCSFGYLKHGLPNQSSQGNCLDGFGNLYVTL